MSNKVEIVQYSEKAIAVFGDTKPYINELKELGGKFNPALTHENEKKAGWIYPKKALEKLQELVTKINAGVVKPSEVSKASSHSSSEKINSVDIKVFMALVSRVERLEQEIKLLHEKAGITSGSSASTSYKSKKEQVTSNIDSGSEYEEETEEERPRLMRGKK